MILDVCSYGAPTDPASMERAMFSDAPGANEQTLQGAFSACSAGMATLSRAKGTRVVERTIPVPCSGQTPGGSWFQSSTCPYAGGLGVWVGVFGGGE